MNLRFGRKVSNQSILGPLHLELQNYWCSRRLERFLERFFQNALGRVVVVLLVSSALSLLYIIVKLYPGIKTKIIDQPPFGIRSHDPSNLSVICPQKVRHQFLNTCHTVTEKSEAIARARRCRSSRLTR
jgi:hypothetical protein